MREDESIENKGFLVFFFLGTIITADQKEDSMLELRQEGIEGTYPL